ncbi:MAG TPA: DUF190 domain-containing protein [Puia sp.]|nr:DUF190 domain-containing protein [Puia sp.]
MKKEINLHVKEMGKLRIYLPQGEKMSGEGLIGKLNKKTVYREIIKAAKNELIMNASAFMTHFGYSQHKPIAQKFTEGNDDDTTLCIELIDNKTKLESFCRKYHSMLKGKTIVYKPVEFWEID